MKRSLFPILATAALLAAAPFATHATHAAQETGLSQAAQDAGEPYVRALAAAGEAYSQRDFSKALDKLDIADQIAPNIPDTWNMRGAIYAEQHAFEKAEDAFEKAGKLNPGDFWPQYNIAQLLLMQKKYGPAAEAFQKLSVYGGHEELVQFKLVYANLLLGNPDAAKPVLDAMKFPCDTPAYYYAHAAWAFSHKDQKEGNYWTAAGVKVFGLERCVSFYDSLEQANWVPMRNTDGTIPMDQELSTLPSGTPGVELSPQAGGTP
jgi:tetratricopeptide (TPR) repeat protein